MQLLMFDQAATTPKKVPTIVVRGVNSDYIAIRFRQIGNPQRFNIILGRFRYDFPLANCQEIAGQPWWVWPPRNVTTRKPLQSVTGCNSSRSNGHAG